MSGFFDANYTVTKLKKKLGKITELEINNKAVELNPAVKLSCYKVDRATDTLYVKTIPEEAGDADVLTVHKNSDSTGNVLEENTATYVKSVVSTCWGARKNASSPILNYYNKDLESIESPEGEIIDTVLLLGAYVIGTDNNYYDQKTAGGSFYKVIELTPTEVICSETAVTDEAFIASLEERATNPDYVRVIDYLTFELADAFKYSSKTYNRFSEGDITIE